MVWDAHSELTWGSYVLVKRSRDEPGISSHIIKAVGSDWGVQNVSPSNVQTAHPVFLSSRSNLENQQIKTRRSCSGWSVSLSRTSRGLTLKWYDVLHGAAMTAVMLIKQISGDSDKKCMTLIWRWNRFLFCADFCIFLLCCCTDILTQPLNVLRRIISTTWSVQWC